MKETAAQSLAEAIAMRLCISLKNVPDIMDVLRKHGVYRQDKMKNYVCDGQMDLVSDFPQYMPDNPQADVSGWMFEEKDDDTEPDRG